MSTCLLAVRRAHQSLGLLPVLMLGTGCASAPRQELSPSELHAALDQRASGPAAPREAVDLAGLEALSLPRPMPEECDDPRSAGYWRACALAWNPSVRETRLHLQRALAARALAGRPGAIEAEIETEELNDLERENKLAVTFDLLGLLGLGPARVAREGARIDVRRAHRHFEAAVWAATFDVERARVRLSAARVRIARLENFLIEVEAHAERFEVLERRGRLSEADLAMIRALNHEIEHAISHERGDEALLRAELARLCGLAFEHEAHDAVDGAVLYGARQLPGSERDAKLWRQDPALRELAFGFAMAEVNVRLVAAGAWPNLRVGPQLTFLPNEVLFGGLLDVSLPWPGTIERELRVAVAEREIARAAIEDALHYARARVAGLRTIEREALRRAEEHAVGMDAGAQAAWDGVDARLRVGRAEIAEWIRISQERLEPLVSFVNEREEAVLALLDLRQACGVVPNSTEVAP